MKRFTLQTRAELDACTRMQKFYSAMQPNAEGEWVRYEDHVSELGVLRAELEAQIPEKRIAKLEAALGLVQEGRCVECRELVRGYNAPSGSFAPEAWATLREHGIDPATGHKDGCSKRNAGRP